MNTIVSVLVLLVFLLNAPAKSTAEIRRIRLDNGMVVLLDEDHSVPVTAIQLWVRIGAKNEEESIYGISHFIEHMAFKGTEKYRVEEIHREVEKRGGIINAGTSRDFTYFYIVLPNIEVYTGTQSLARKDSWKRESPGLKTCLDILLQVSEKSVFPADEIERERSVILEEIKRKGDDPQGYLWDAFNSALYAGSPYGHPVLGTAETVRNLSRKTILEYYRRHYVPQNFVLVVTGDFSSGNVLRQVREFFAEKPYSRVSARLRHPGAALADAIPETREIRIEKDVHQAYIIFGTQGPRGNDKDAYAMDVAAYVLGKGRASRLYRVLREQKGLVWDVECSYLTQVEKGPFYIYAECEPGKIPEVKEEIINQVKRMSEEPVAEREFARALALLETEHLLSLQTFQGRAFNAGYYEMVGSYKLGTEYLKNIRKVTAKDLQRIAKKYLDPERFVCVMVVPSSAH